MSDSSTETVDARPPIAMAWPQPRPYVLVYAALTLTLLLMLLLELAIGAVHVPLPEVLRILAGAGTADETLSRIVLQFRLPRLLTAAVSGAALGCCGLMLQTLFRNPLADPYVLGIVHGGRLGVAVVVVIAGAAGDTFFAKFGLLGGLSFTAAAGLGCVAVLLLMMLVSRRVSTVTLLIVGLMLGYLAQGLVSVVLHFTDEFQAGVFETWNDGSYAGVTQEQLWVLVPVIAIGLLLSLSLVKPMNALLLGEHYARTLGVHVTRVRVLAFTSVALLAGTVTAYCGPVAFVGIIVAHVCRGMLRTSDHRVLVPATMLTGALLALTADLITHLPWSRHFLHMNAVNGLIGAPIVLWVLLRGRAARALEA